MTCALPSLPLESCSPSQDSVGLQEGLVLCPSLPPSKTKNVLCLATVCNSWRDTILVFHHSYEITVIYSWALCTLQKKVMDTSNSHMEPKETERKIHKNNSKAKCVYEKKYIGKKYISKFLIP